MPGGDGQLALPLGAAPTYRLGDFLAAPSNAAAREWLDHAGEWPNGRLALFGPEGCGKTHLAHCWAAEGLAVLWCAGRALTAVPELADHARVVVDAADTADETALLHWLNACAEGGRRLLLTGRAAPSRWTVGLADLSSRLRSVQAVAIDPPDDALLRALLARLLAECQLAVPEAVQDWLLTRLARTPAALQDAVGRLDRASLAGGQPVTRALARACLPELEAGEAHQDEGKARGFAPSTPIAGRPPKPPFLRA